MQYGDRGAKRCALLYKLENPSLNSEKNLYECYHLGYKITYLYFATQNFSYRKTIRNEL